MGEQQGAEIWTETILPDAVVVAAGHRMLASVAVSADAVVVRPVGAAEWFIPLAAVTDIRCAPLMDVLATDRGVVTLGPRVGTLARITAFAVTRAGGWASGALTVADYQERYQSGLANISSRVTLYLRDTRNMPEPRRRYESRAFTPAQAWIGALLIVAAISVAYLVGAALLNHLP